MTRRHAVTLGAVLAFAAAAAVYVALRPQAEPRVLSSDQPLPLGETVKLEFRDEESGEAEVWTVTKRDTRPEDRPGPPPLPSPDPDRDEHTPDDSARALDAQGLESWKNGRIEQAVGLFERAIEIDPDDPEPRTHLGRLLTMAVSFEQARPHLERAAELRPDDPQVWLDLATLYEKTLALDRSWQAQRRAQELAGGREIERAEHGFWVIEGQSIYP